MSEAALSLLISLINIFTIGVVFNFLFRLLRVDYYNPLVQGIIKAVDFPSKILRFGDNLVILCAFFWALHIIFIGKFIKIFDIPLFFGALQALVVASFSFLFG